VLSVGAALARSPRARALAALALAWHAGALALAARLADAGSGHSGPPAERTLEATVVETRESARGVRLVLGDVSGVDAADTRPLPPRVLLLGDPQDAALRALPPGARVRAELRLREPMPLRNPGRPGEGAALARAGIAAVATLVDPRLLVRVPERDRVDLAAPWHAPRRRAAARLHALGPGGALLAALALGDRSGLTPADEDAWARLGLSHLLSVSGLHLVLVAGLVYAPVAACLRRWAGLAARMDSRAVARWIAVLAATAYALLAGFEVPVRRSLVLVAASAVALAAARPERAFHPLAAGALWVLAAEPAALFDAGAQLSFVACAALISAAHRRPAGSRRSGARAWLSSLLRTTATASGATAPIAAWHGLPAAPLALLCNAVAVPWTGAVLLPASLGAALLALTAAPWAGLPLRLAERSAALSLALVRAAPQGALTRGGGAPSLTLLGVSAGLAIALWRARTTRVRCALALLVAGLLCWGPPDPVAPPPPRLVAFDVGSGDALLVQGRTASLLVDGGPALEGRFDRGRDAVLPALRALGVRRLDLVVATHADLDHRGGLPAILAALPVGALWLPYGGTLDPGFTPLLAAARSAYVPVQEQGLGAPAAEVGDLRIVPLWPPREGRAARNERSLGLRVESGPHRLLLLGDLGSDERALLARSAPLRADVLVLPHHGSRRSSSAELLAAVDPSVAIVSAPCRGRLPHPSALARARASGASLWWTGRDGAVRVALGRQLAVLPYADARRGCTGSSD
jgi:competence protein ComEC